MNLTYINPDENRGIIDELLTNGDNLPYSRIVELCNVAFPRIPISIYNFENQPFELQQMEMGGTNIIYRAREIKNKDNVPFDKASELSYIPDELLNIIKDFGRANKPGQSMFYGAFDYPVACTECIVNGKEIIAKGSTLFVVGMWKIQERLKLAQIPHSEGIFTEFYDTVDFKSETIQLQDIQKLNATIKNQINSDYDYKNLMFFADQFARFDEKNSYKLSNYYCDRIFNNVVNLKTPQYIEGIIYPSIVNSFQKENIVLRPSVVDKKLKFIGAMLVYFVPATGGTKGAQFHPFRQHV
ncbi:RES domain-containing protein, partial [Chryseobacterium indologenes]|nr:RES domain-containing protein [Chryseobacterium indologenes]